MALGETKPLAVGNAVRLVATVAATTAGFWLGQRADVAAVTNYGPLIGFMVGNSLGALVAAVVIAQSLRKQDVHIALLDFGATLAFGAVGAVGCGGPVLLAPYVGVHPAYLTLVSVVVLLGPIGAVVALRTRRELRASRAARHG